MREEPDSAVVIEGDDGGTIYLTVPVRHVRCTQAVLQQLADDIDAMCWNDRSGLSLFFEYLPVGAGVAGGMGGGEVIDGIWLHPAVETLEIGAQVDEVLEWRHDRLRTRDRRRR